MLEMIVFVSVYFQGAGGDILFVSKDSNAKSGKLEAIFPHNTVNLCTCACMFLIVVPVPI